MSQPGRAEVVSYQAAMVLQRSVTQQLAAAMLLLLLLLLLLLPAGNMPMQGSAILILLPDLLQQPIWICACPPELRTHAASRAATVQQQSRTFMSAKVASDSAVEPQRDERHHWQL
jgi:hypothetical protein